MACVVTMPLSRMEMLPSGGLERRLSHRPPLAGPGVRGRDWRPAPQGLDNEVRCLRDEPGYLKLKEAVPNNVPCMPKKMGSLSSATIGRNIFIGGGSQSEAGSPPTGVHRLDYDGDCSWTELTPCEYPVAYFALASVGGRLHMAGGLHVSNKRPMGSGQMSKDVYTFSDNRWQANLPALSIGRCRAGAVGFQQYMIVAGGLTATGRTDSVELLDTSSHNRGWARLPPLPKTLERPQLTVAEGRLIVGLGFDASGRENSELYHASLDSIKKCSLGLLRPGKAGRFWRKYCDVSVKMATLTTHLDSPVLVGGHMPVDDSCAGVQVYCSNRQQWMETLPLDRLRCRPGVAIVGGHRLCLFGGHMSEKGLTDSVDIVPLTHDFI